jgi:hypothetical protein
LKSKGANTNRSTVLLRFVSPVRKGKNMSSLTLLFTANFWLVGFVQDPVTVADPAPVVVQESTPENTGESVPGTAKSAEQDQPTFVLDVSKLTTQQDISYGLDQAVEGIYFEVANYSDFVPNRSQFGVHIRRADDTLRKHLKIKSGIGLVVESVVPESGAAAAGVQIDDVLLKFDDQWLINSEQFTTLVQNSAVGQEVKVTLVREGLSQELLVTLSAGATGDDIVGISSVNLSFTQAPSDDFHKNLPEASNCSNCHQSNFGAKAATQWRALLKYVPDATTESAETEAKK